MADVIETVIPLAPDSNVSYRQTIPPTYLKTSYVADDADDHLMRVDGRGKGRMTVAVSNPSNKDVVATVYGMHLIGGSVGDADVFEIGGSGGGSFTAPATGKNYDCNNDPFPFYLIVMTSAASGDSEVVTCWVSFQTQ